MTELAEWLISLLSLLLLLALAAAAWACLARAALYLAGFQ